MTPDGYSPPARFADVSFDTYQPQTPGQEDAKNWARRFAEAVRGRYTGFRLFGWRTRDEGLGAGLYLVGPVGTGKTHLLASIYHALHPEVPCAFVHSSALFRATARPEDYAKSLTRRFRLLLIDEIELDDPAAEVRLIGVLKALRKLGVTVAATSNAEPEKFVSAEFGRDRLERFISEEFRRQYQVVFVGGEDFRQRLEKSGRAWIGPSGATQAAMQQAYDNARGSKRWITFTDLLRLATDTERTVLARDLAAPDGLFIEDIQIRDTDDALRLLRIVDDLYGEPKPPTLFFTAQEPPAQWFTVATAREGLERSIAEKFTRTTSRLTALAALDYVEAD